MADFCVAVFSKIAPNNNIIVLNFGVILVDIFDHVAFSWDQFVGLPSRLLNFIFQVIVSMVESKFKNILKPRGEVSLLRNSSD